MERRNFMKTPIKIDVQSRGRQVVYTFGARLDPKSITDVETHIMLARRMYNNIIAIMRDIHAEMQDFVMEQAGKVATRPLHVVAGPYQQPLQVAVPIYIDNYDDNSYRKHNIWCFRGLAWQA
jgi:hypothetical protein